MSQCFVIRNHQNFYLDKHKEWVDGRENQLLFRTQHRDEAINMVVELSSKDISLRAQYIECELNNKKHPIVEVFVEESALATQQELTEESSPAEEKPTELKEETA